MAPSLFHRWQEQLIVNSALALEGKRTERSQEQQRIEKLENKIRQKDEVLAELMAEHVALKKRVWGTLNGGWVEPDVRDAIVVFIRTWLDKTGLSIELLLQWLNLSGGKYYGWRQRYGQTNRHSGWVPRDFWLTGWEKKAILDFQELYPVEGYRCPTQERDV